VLQYWLLGLAMMLVIEGLLPFLLPELWRETFRKLVTRDRRTAALYRTYLDVVRAVVVVFDQMMGT